MKFTTSKDWVVQMAALCLLSLCIASTVGAAGDDSHWSELKRFQGLWTKPQPETGLFNLAPLSKMEDVEVPTPPLKGEYLKQFEATMARFNAVNKAPPPASGEARSPGRSGCMNGSMPSMMLGGLLLEFVASPNGLYVISEQDPAVRRIYTDGRMHPSSDDLIPNHSGDSIGHWQGKTLVVDTIGIVEGMIDGHSGHSDALHITERFTLLDDNKMQDEITLEDAKALTRPWSSKFIYTRSKYTSALEPDCETSKAGEREF